MNHPGDGVHPIQWRGISPCADAHAIDRSVNGETQVEGIVIVDMFHVDFAWRFKVWDAVEMLMGMLNRISQVFHAGTGSCTTWYIVPHMTLNIMAS